MMLGNMALFRIHRIKEAAQQNFRWAPHTSGVTAAKPKDYEPGGIVESAGLYQAWRQVLETPDALRLGDILESVESGEMRICKYVGFEEAKWFVPELTVAKVEDSKQSANTETPQLARAAGAA